MITNLNMTARVKKAEIERLLPMIDDVLPQLLNRSKSVAPNIHRWNENVIASQDDQPEHHKHPSEKGLADISHDVGKALAINNILMLVPEMRPLARVVGKTMQTDSLMEGAMQEIPLQN